MYLLKLATLLLILAVPLAACPYHDPDLPTWSPIGEGYFMTSSFLQNDEGKFHPGITWATKQKEGLEVQTPEAGYVLELRESSSGYGKSLLLQGASGHQWLFGHLSSFTPALDSAFTAYKRQQKSHELTWKPPRNASTEFKEYETVGFSGKSGVAEPSVSLEMRSGQGKSLLNPCFYGIACEDSVPIQLVGAAVWDASNPSLPLSLTSAAAIKQGCLEVNPDFTEPRLALQFLDYSTPERKKTTGIYELSLQVGEKHQFIKEYQELGIQQTDVIFEEILWAETAHNPGDWHLMAPGTRPNPSTKGSATGFSQALRNMVRAPERKAKNNPLKIDVLDFHFNRSYFAVVPRPSCTPAYSTALRQRQDSLLFTFLSRPWINLNTCAQNSAKVSLLDGEKHILSSTICSEFTPENHQIAAILQKYPTARTLTLSAAGKSRAIALHPIKLSPNQHIAWHQDGVHLEFTQHRPLFPTALAWEITPDNGSQPAALTVHPQGFYTASPVKTCWQISDPKARLFVKNPLTQKSTWASLQSDTTINGNAYRCATSSELKSYVAQVDSTAPQLGTPQSTTVSALGKSAPAWRIPVRESESGLTGANAISAEQGTTWIHLTYHPHRAEIIILKSHLQSGAPLRLELRDAAGNTSISNLKL